MCPFACCVYYCVQECYIYNIHACVCKLFQEHLSLRRTSIVRTQRWLVCHQHRWKTSGKSWITPSFNTVMLAHTMCMHVSMSCLAIYMYSVHVAQQSALYMYKSVVLWAQVLFEAVLFSTKKFYVGLPFSFRVSSFLMYILCTCSSLCACMYAGL